MAHLRILYSQYPEIACALIAFIQPFANRKKEFINRYVFNFSVSPCAFHFSPLGPCDCLRAIIGELRENGIQIKGIILECRFRQPTGIVSYLTNGSGDKNGHRLFHMCRRL